MTRRFARAWALSGVLIVAAGACTGLIGGGEEGEGEVAVASDGLGATPLRRLTRLQYDNTVRDLLGIDAGFADAFAPDEKIGVFHSNAVAPVTELDIESYMAAAEGIALEAVTDLDSLLPCDPVNGEDACAEQLIDQLGARAYRRPLSEEESQQLRGVYAVGKQTNFASGIRLVIQAVLQSPHFLYHVEPMGEPGERSKLDGYALAARLSYFLWSSMPDDELFSAAAAGELDDPAGIREQAVRMLADDKARATITSFHRQWLGLDDFAQLSKDPEIFPQFDASMQSAMLAETERFVDYVVREGDGKLATLLTADFSFPGPELQNLYGIEESAGEAPVSLDPAERSGLLTHASVLSMHSHPDQTSPIHRGVMVRQNVLCQALPTPPENVNNTPPDPDPSLTTRERFAEHTEDPTCAGCHKLIDGIGFGFEGYDALGAFRADENGTAVDTSGEIAAAEGIEGTFDGVVELSQILAESEIVRRCMAAQWFRYAFGRIEDDADEEQLEVIHEAFAASEWNVRELILAITTSEAFLYRQNPEEGTP